jgi:hypothetical protein
MTKRNPYIWIPPDEFQRVEEDPATAPARLREALDRANRLDAIAPLTALDHELAISSLDEILA